MFRSYNGHCTKSVEVEENNSAEFQIEEGSNDSDNNFNSSETDFRGFEKVPIVLCQRLDITPYLNKIKYPLAKKIKSNIMSDVISNDCSTNQLLLTCSVVLVRDDLDKLKAIVKNKEQPNANDLKCTICDKRYSTKKKLQNHKENKHMIVYKAESKAHKRVSFSDQIIVHEVKQYHRCRKCPRIFENYNTLRIHMRLKHKKRKCYICDYCSKDFVDRVFFKLHIKLHCDACGLLLTNKKKYVDHKRFMCRVKKRYNCKICNMTFFTHMDLKEHSYEHLSTFFICDICKDQFETKCEVTHHITFRHTERHSNELYVKQDDGSFKCNHCEETTEQQHDIERHVSTLPDLQDRLMTGYKDYNFCDVCLKKFTTKKELLQHQWTHFLKTSDNSQLRNEEIVSNNKVLKTMYKFNEELPECFKPKVVLTKMKMPTVPPVEQSKQEEVTNEVQRFVSKDTLKKAVIDPVTKKTIISKHRCEKCGKYLSSNYCLNRHLHSVHGVVKESNEIKNLQCSYCEEIFVWPSLLQSHNCIRMGLPELPFDDARPEIYFDNAYEVNQVDVNTSNISDDDDYMNAEDIEIPAPIVELTEFEHLNIVVNGGNGKLNVINNKRFPINNLGYKVVMQEVPIEF